MERQTERPARVIAFWRTVEMLSPQTVPKPTRFARGADRAVIQLEADELAPWELGHPLTVQPPHRSKTWQFTVYGGLYELSAMQDVLVEHFGEDERPSDGRPRGETALFAFTLDADGCVMEDSAVLSSSAWAISRLRSRRGRSVDPSWLDGFEDDQRGFTLGLNKLVPPRPRATSAEHGPMSKAAGVVVAQAKGAAIDAVAEGAKATGVAVTGVTAAAVGSMAGPVVGGIAGAVAGKFAERFLTPRAGEKLDGATTDRQANIPRLRMTAKALHEFIAELSSSFGLTQVLRPSGVRVFCRQVPVKDTADPPEQGFLNSFIADDLSLVGRAVRDGHVGAALRDYLTDNQDIRTDRRVDVVGDSTTRVVDGVAPRRIPGGRWPTDLGKPLVLSQQFAVNQIMADLAGRPGIFAVNGPPGTGKTTMLRDLLAAIVIDRATRLAELGDPADAFTVELDTVQLTKTYQATVHELRPELTGFEVVLATTGNDAAANVTAEIPGVRAVGDRLEEARAVDYFSALATDVLDDDAWGLIAGQLGNRKLRGTFASRFWWGDTSMQKILRSARESPEKVDDWAAAVARFRHASAQVERLAAERQLVADAITDLTRCRALINTADQRFRQADDTWYKAKADVAECAGRLAHAAAAYDAIDAEYKDHRQDRPGLRVSISTLFRADREWHREHERLKEARAASTVEWDRINQWLAHHRAAQDEAAAERSRHQRDRDSAERRLAEAKSCVATALPRWPDTVPLRPEFATEEEFQLCSPWADEEFTAARNRLFLEALRLHKTFILRAGVQLQHNLAVAVKLIGDNLPMRPATRLAVWQSLFLVVPLVSTTFASLPRLFTGLGSEDLGWLFIDEAGQVAPQGAVGGIWRARHAVIVGDPRQLEPVVTLPSSAQRALLRGFRVDEQWLPDRTSAQQVADRQARFGTALADQQGEDPIWIGAPLRVHRRCDFPMFDISNKIAYGGRLMVYGTAERDPYPGDNRWIDVRSAQADGNWVPAEGDALTDLLATLVQDGCRDFRVISPFRDVVSGARKRVPRRHAARIGTVHTVQGQEFDVVILVLGGPHYGARQWAAESPNLLNVAVSRAKRRLYVIGNRQNWAELPHFNVLAGALR